MGRRKPFVSGASKQTAQVGGTVPILTSCKICSVDFPSKRRLFDHLRIEGTECSKQAVASGALKAVVGASKRYAMLVGYIRYGSEVPPAGSQGDWVEGQLWDAVDKAREDIKLGRNSTKATNARSTECQAGLQESEAPASSSGGLPENEPVGGSQYCWPKRTWQGPWEVNSVVSLVERGFIKGKKEIEGTQTKQRCERSDCEVEVDSDGAVESREVEKIVEAIIQAVFQRDRSNGYGYGRNSENGEAGGDAKPE
eukprot:CAMPEP_0196594368 /NCGR_PEP_ID=MMETSP1081-20130531/78171_1 /TAXON_ID=36882 /ORGANISM="Pyramimonas amylifera, Strain CCMP720" /LENGTH=253 /DNA_ID=CAMNT_0041918619 /DNA_START=53 /DNA_END=811 /DNA_ORIENTATION=-